MEYGIRNLLFNNLLNESIVKNLLSYFFEYNLILLSMVKQDTLYPNLVNVCYFRIKDLLSSVVRLWILYKL